MAERLIDHREKRRQRADSLPAYNQERRGSKPDSMRPMNLIDYGQQSSTVQIRIGAAVFGLNLARVGAECQKLNNIGADFLRFEISDGHMVPGRLTFGPEIMAAVHKQLGTAAVVDVRLVVDKPTKYIAALKLAGAHRVVVQYESATAEELTNALAQIRADGMKAGLAIMPATQVGLIYTFLDYIDGATVLTAEPSEPEVFLPKTLEKVERIHKDYPSLEIEVSGAIGPSNVHQCSTHGARAFVASAGVAASADPAEVWNRMRASVVREATDRRQSYNLTKYYQLDEEAEILQQTKM